MREKSIRNKKPLIYAAFAVCVLVFIVLSLRSCMRLIKSPSGGDSRAALYNSKDIADEAKLMHKDVEASATKLSDPANFDFLPYLLVDGLAVDNYLRQNDAIFSGTGNEQETEGKPSGIFTYRGNAMRNSASSSETVISGKKFGATWQVSLSENKSVHSELDWRGQALIIKWDDNSRARLKMGETTKNKEGLTEVIYAAKDGKVYFLDIEDGSYTRDPLNLGCPVTGSGSILCKGLPCYVVGLGDCTSDKNTSYVVINLLNCEIIKSFGERKNFSQELPDEKYDFSAAALFSDSGNCMITRGENGVIYSHAIDLISADGSSEIVFAQELCYTYHTGEEKNIPTGISGLAAWDKYLYSCDDKGHVVCTDINDWHTVWVRDMGLKIDMAPVLCEDEEKKTVFLYVGSAVDRNAGKNSRGLAYLTKLNAANGDIIWQREYESKVTKSTDGGALSSPAIGEKGLDNYIFFTMAAADSKKAGKLVALNKETGGEHYTVEFKHYLVSEPVCVYDSAGKGYVIVCDSDGNLFLLDGENGKSVDMRKIGERITTCPVIYNNTLIIGSDKKIYGIRLE